jgi:ADP-heptose:LPS heptosyltransferase
LDSPAFTSNKPKAKIIDFRYDKKLLILAEQGVGDQVLYASMLEKLFDLVPSCQVMLDSRLTPLLSRSFPDRIFIDNKTNSNVIEHDEHLSIADLGKFFRSNIDDFNSSRNSYLIADQTRATKIRQALINNKKFLCGITWSSKTEKIGASKSISLEHLLPILNINNISFVSLQYGNVKDQLIEFNKNHNVNIQECNTVDNFYDLDGHAALIEACDFVVTISNTSAHFSGALGKKTYLLSSFGKGSLWYWSNHVNGKSIWYPNMQIFEQTKQGQWDDVVQEIKSVIESNI